MLLWKSTLEIIICKWEFLTIYWPREAIVQYPEAVSTVKMNLMVQSNGRSVPHTQHACLRVIMLT